MLNKRTKVVCTIGPSTDKPGVLENMIEAGMNVARFNFSHGTYEEHERRIAAVREASKKVNIPVALMLDTKGPEIRLRHFENKEVYLKKGNKFTLTTREILGNEEICSVTHIGLPNDVKVGTKILLADGLVTLVVDEITDTEIYTTIQNSGKMSDRKRVAAPGIPITLPPVSKADENDLRFACKHDMDFIAASFMQRGEDVVAIRRILEDEDSDIQIISKIENEEGILKIDDIVKMSDGIMVARGDLGVEIPAEEVPIFQKMLIRKCNKAGKPVITATQMLESMTQNPRPTRAETSDVANAIIDGTDAIMLSGETASGKYPVEAVRTMTRVAMVTEKAMTNIYEPQEVQNEEKMTSKAISCATVSIADQLQASAIITATESGGSALSVASNRPQAKIVAVTPYERTVRRCQLYWGVTAIKGSETKNSDELVMEAMANALNHGYVNSGETVVVTAGIPSGYTGQTNMIRVHVAGDVLIRAVGIGKTPVTGRLCVANNIKDVEENFFEGDILVVPEVDSDFIPYIKRSKGIITQEAGYSSTAAIVSINLDIPVILDAQNAVKKLRTGMLVTLDGASGQVIEHR